MNVIDLGAVRANREAVATIAKSTSDTLFDLAGRLAKSYARMAFSVSAPLLEANRVFAIDINRSQLRRAKTEVRGPLRKQGFGKDAVDNVLKYIEDIYWNEINNLWWDYLRSMGRDPGAEATAEMLTELKPWPSCFMLTSEAIISWLDLIHRTGGKLKPRTRTALVRARAELEAGNVLGSDTEALIDRLIRARWKQGHTMAWRNMWDNVMAASA